MPTFHVETPPVSYDAVVRRGVLDDAARYVPANAGKVFVVSTEDVWRHQCARLEHGLAAIPHEVLFLPGGEDQKRLAPTGPA
jgi:3-dehydroquinate synthase